MKITVDIDCTPEEARAFLGLPDVKPMQEQLMQEMQDRMVSHMRSLAPEELMKTWLPEGVAGFDQMRDFLLKAGGGRKK